MIQKTFVQNNGKSVAQVTFTIPGSIWADKIHLVGDFNNWDRGSHPFQQESDGRWTLSLELEQDRVFQFRYVLDSEGWTGESQADAELRHPKGNFVVVTDPNFKRYAD